MEIFNPDVLTKSDNWGVLFGLVFTLILALYLFDLLTIYFLLKAGQPSIHLPKP